MKSSVTKTFRKRLNDLPASVQDRAAKAYALWQEVRIIPAFSLSESVKSSRFTPLVSALTIGFWVCWSPIVFIGTGLAHMMNMMSC
jgi:hypothetical protein